MKQSELGDIIASGRATPQEWDEYWSAYASDVERQRQEQDQEEMELARTRAQYKPVEEVYPPERYYPADEHDETVERERNETPRGGRAGAAGAAGIGLGSAIAVVLSFQLNRSVLWAIVHGILSWLYVIYRAWQGNY
jgi:hypothetical protein